MLKKIWTRIGLFYQQKQTTLYSSALVVACTLIFARLLGVIKLHILTNYFNGRDLDLFFAAFRIPDLIFEVLIAGSISTCFIPLVSDMLVKGQNKRQIMVFSQTLITIFFGLWILILLVISPFYLTINQYLVPGYHGADVKMISNMSWWILVIQVPFLLIANVLVALLQQEKQFFIPGLAPVFYNLGIILGVVFFARNLGLIAALYGVGLGAILYFLVVLPGPKNFGYPRVGKIDLWTKEIKQFFKMFGPRLFSSLVGQIDATVDLALATLGSRGSYSAFYLAQNVQILPVSFFGIALSQTALPFLSDLYNKEEKGQFLSVLVKLLFQVLFIIFPIVIFFSVLRVPIIRLLFGGDKFDWNSTLTTAMTLSFFALSIPAHTAYYVITRAFFAIQDTKTPFIWGVVSTILNSLLSLVFIYFWHLPVWFLAISFTIAITLNSLILLFILVKRLDHIRVRPIIIHFFVLLLITIVSGFLVWVFKQLFDVLVFDTSRTFILAIFTGIAILIGYASYLYLTWIFLPDDLTNFYQLFSRLEVVKVTIIRYRKIFYPEKLSLPLEEKV